MTNIPESNRKVFAISFIIAVIALFSFVAYTKYQAKHSPLGKYGEVMAENPNPNKVFDAPFTEANLYYIDLEKFAEDNTNKNSIGCGDGLIAYKIPIEEAYGGTKSDTATYILDRLFNNKVFEDAKSQSEISGVKYKNPYNVLANSKLTVESIKDVPGEYEVRLKGKLLSGGACEDPRIMAVIKNSIEQVFSPAPVDIYVNNKKLDEALSSK